MITKWIVLWSIFVATTCMAEQKIVIKEGETVTAHVSNVGLNRIAVADDRILSIKGITGQFQMDKDPHLGQIFLQPTLVDKDDPIHLFITTEKGNTFTLSLLTHELAPENIVLVPQTVETIKQEKTSNYDMKLINLIKAMHNQMPIDGYSIKTINNKSKSLYGATVIHLQSFMGDKIKGEHYEIYNGKKDMVHLRVKDFYMDDVHAIAIMNNILLPGTKTQVYLIKKNHE